jgi:hypothetical protein
MKQILALYLGILALLAVDPYSYGYPGSDRDLNTYPWQVGASGALAVIITLGVGAAIRRQWSLARWLFLAEGLSFIVLNAIYFLRDGLGRIIWGFEHSGLGLLVIIAGLALRGMLYRAIRKHRHGQDIQDVVQNSAR